jgi:hypothetical protein
MKDPILEILKNKDVIVLSTEQTFESAIYSVQKGNVIHFLEVYRNEDYAIMSRYRGDYKLSTITGTVEKVLKEL